MSTSNKVFTIFAGVNGCGKTTLYDALGCDFGIRINSDEIIKTQFDNKWKDPNTQLAAGKIAVRMIHDCIENGKSFNQETTLGGTASIYLAQKAKEAGFKINLYFIAIESAGLAIKRVKHRVKRGGHAVDNSTIIKRYSRSLENLKHLFPICDRVFVFDNSKSGVVDVMRPLAFIQDKTIRTLNSDCPRYMKDLITGEFEFPKTEASQTKAVKVSKPTDTAGGKR